MENINQNLLETDLAFVSLMSAPGKEGFYEKFGFTKRPDAERGSGMSQYIRE